MRKPLTTIPQTSACFGHEGTRKPANNKLQQKAFCITGGESEALGFHQETTEESRTQQNWFCIKLYIICTRLASFWLYGSRKRN